jgi:hypothetical protein
MNSHMDHQILFFTRDRNNLLLFKTKTCVRTSNVHMYMATIYLLVFLHFKYVFKPWVHMHQRAEFGFMLYNTWLGSYMAETPSIMFRVNRPYL